MPRRLGRITGPACGAFEAFSRWFWSGTVPKVVTFWLSAIIIDGAILFMALVGILNSIVPPAKLPLLIEVTSQTINGLFVSEAIISHPGRLRAAYLLACDWERLQSERNDGLSRATVARILLLLNINCFVQYVLCVFMWGFGQKRRPLLGILICILIALTTGVGGAVYQSRARASAALLKAPAPPTQGDSSTAVDLDEEEDIEICRTPSASEGILHHETA